MKQITMIGSRVLPEAEAAVVRAQVSAAILARNGLNLAQRRMSRLPDAPDRRSVAVAMLSVEIRLAKAFWTIARQPLGAAAPGSSRSNGISYFHDREDTHARYTDAPSGKWETIAPRPPLPSSKDIDAANEALEWLLLIQDEGLRKLLVVGATSKRGDAGRRINWIRLRPSLPQYREATVRTIQRYYQQALRIIVTELTIARMSSLSHISV